MGSKDYLTLLGWWLRASPLGESFFLVQGKVGISEGVWGKGVNKRKRSRLMEQRASEGGKGIDVNRRGSCLRWEGCALHSNEG